MQMKDLYLAIAFEFWQWISDSVWFYVTVSKHLVCLTIWIMTICDVTGRSADSVFWFTGSGVLWCYCDVSFTEPEGPNLKLISDIWRHQMVCVWCVSMRENLLLNLLGVLPQTPHSSSQLTQKTSNMSNINKEKTVPSVFGISTHKRSNQQTSQRTM